MVRSSEVRITAQRSPLKNTGFWETYLMSAKSWYCGLLAAAVLFCGCAGETNTVKSVKKMVKFETSMGDIVVELDEIAAPVTVKNFLQYLENGFYDGTIFHRVIQKFMVQAGGFTADMQRKQTRAPIVNEAHNGLRNDRGTIAMARGGDPDSATSQFYINTNPENNDGLNYIENVQPGYAVFGKVVQGMDVVDAIAAVRTTVRMDLGMKDVPVKPVVIKSAKLVSE